MALSRVYSGLTPKISGRDSGRTETEKISVDGDMSQHMFSTFLATSQCYSSLRRLESPKLPINVS